MENILKDLSVDTHVITAYVARIISILYTCIGLPWQYGAVHRLRSFLGLLRKISLPTWPSKATERKCVHMDVRGELATVTSLIPLWVLEIKLGLSVLAANFLTHWAISLSWTLFNLTLPQKQGYKLNEIVESFCCFGFLGRGEMEGGLGIKPMANTHSAVIIPLGYPLSHEGLFLRCPACIILNVL